MNFFLDENFPYSALSFLRSFGHSAVHALEIFPPGKTDIELFDYAQQTHAIFITTDKDFFHTVPWTFQNHYGAIVITLRRPNRFDLLRRLSDGLNTLGQRSFDNGAWLITDTRIYSRLRN